MYEQQRHRTGTSRSITPNIVPERLAESLVLSIPILTPKYLLSSQWIPVLFPTYSLSLRSEYSMIVPIHATLKRSTELIRFVTLLFRD